MSSGTKKNIPKGSETPDAPEAEHAKVYIHYPAIVLACFGYF